MEKKRRARIWNPCKWRLSETILVFGELTSLIIAILATFSENATQMLGIAGIVGASALTWYAWSMASQGISPFFPRHSVDDKDRESHD